jgi:hypothetical protein
VKIDHVVLVTRNVDASAERVLDATGLDSLAGGDHANWGTTNRLVPVGEQYVEILGVKELAVAEGHPIGQWVARESVEADRLVAVALATDDLDQVCARLHLTPSPGARQGGDGADLSWRLAGVEAAISRGFPFFIEWTPPLEGGLPASATQNGAVFERLDLGGDVRALTEWLGQDVPGVNLVGGEPGIREVVISTPDGPVHLPERL